MHSMERGALFFACLYVGVLISGSIIEHKQRDKQDKQNLQPNYILTTQIGRPYYANNDGIKGNETYMKIGDKLYSVKDSCGTAKLVPYNGLEGKTEIKK